MINMMLFNPENPVILSIYRQGVRSFFTSAFCVQRSTLGVRKRRDRRRLKTYYLSPITYYFLLPLSLGQNSGPAGIIEQEQRRLTGPILLTSMGTKPSLNAGESGRSA